MGNKKGTRKLAGTAVLASLVIVFDYALKYSGLKIPFPWYPAIKFDFTGVPIVMSLLMYGFPSAITTSLVAGIGITARSGNILSASMKVVAELSMIIGLFFGEITLPEASKKNRILASGLGVASRVLIMSVVNIIVLPNVYHVPHEATVGLLPVIGAFNVIQGSLTTGLGFFLFGEIKKRLPQWSDT